MISTMNNVKTRGTVWRTSREWLILINHVLFVIKGIPAFTQVLVGTLAALYRAIHSSHASTQGSFIVKRPVRVSLTSLESITSGFSQPRFSPPPLLALSSAAVPTSVHKKMDMSNPAAFVNAEILHFYVGRRVRALMQVVRSDGGVVIGKSTDEKQLVVKGFPPAPLTTFVEVFGIVNSDKSIAAEIWINFGDSIDMFNYNKLCQLANGELKYLFL